jgi:hypothetical protein
VAPTTTRAGFKCTFRADPPTGEKGGLNATPGGRLIGDEIEQFWSEIALLMYESALRFKNPRFREEC